MGNSITDFIAQHSPAILSGCAIAGVVGTAALTAHAVPQAEDILFKEKYERKEPELPLIDTIKLTWKVYLPAVLMGAATIGCIVGSSAQSNARNAALASAYGLASATLNEYKDKVVEVIGEKKEQEIRDRIADDHMKANPPREKDIVPTDKGNTLCFDRLSGRYFYSDIEYINRCIVDLNRVLVADDWVDLNWLYDRLGLEPVGMGDSYGWHSGQEVELKPSSRLAPNTDTPCYVVDFSEPPVLQATAAYGY